MERSADSSTLPQAALGLWSRMTAISERAWARPWVDHLEYVLWYATMHGAMRYGATDLSARELAALARDARGAALWITRERDGALRALSLRDWQDRFTANIDLCDVG